MSNPTDEWSAERAIFDRAVLCLSACQGIPSSALGRVREMVQILDDLTANYQFLVDSDGAGHNMAATGRYTAGMWVGSRLERHMQRAKLLLSEINLAAGSPICGATDD